jgi:hypothetical protein
MVRYNIWFVGSIQYWMHHTIQVRNCLPIIILDCFWLVFGLILRHFVNSLLPGTLRGRCHAVNNRIDLCTRVIQALRWCTYNSAVSPFLSSADSTYITTWQPPCTKYSLGSASDAPHSNIAETPRGCSRWKKRQQRKHGTLRT